eukprot:TRINITY_DN38682_c0_g1_i1.p1 TRINITY_DN38682_c0_g1~~TRINITY_DN38682_c0_g1_i1.p1  ORF type:complete len:225 (-),score=36.21 TRINITY_DN38682_c0_g1_i1:14-688(-)
MQRCYDEEKLLKYFGYKHGAYALSDTRRLMPNIAIYCKTPMRSAHDGKTLRDVHVINAVGYGFDSFEQPDYKYFLPLTDEKWNELLLRMQQLWRYIFECAHRQGLRTVYLANVGGGVFSSGLESGASNPERSYSNLKDSSLRPVLEQYPKIKVKPLPRVPDWIFTREGQTEISHSLLVNAWDPWSMVGNGNFADNSLDGFFGRSTAMAVLCWPETNPSMKWESI